MVAIKHFESAAFRARRLLVFTASLTLLLATGCASHKLRYTDIGCVSATAQLHDGVAAYNEIEISGPTDPTAPRISLKMPGGQVVERRAFTYVALKKAGFEDVQGDAQEPSATYDYRLSKYGVVFVFFNGTLVSMHMSKTTTTEVAVGRERTKNFYTLPLTQKQLEEVFGKPDKMADKFHL